MIDAVYGQIEEHPTLQRWRFQPKTFAASAKPASVRSSSRWRTAIRSMRALAVARLLSPRSARAGADPQRQQCALRFSHGRRAQVERLESVRQTSGRGDEPSRHDHRRLPRFRQTLQDILELSAAPVMASHSCARALCSAARNLSDDMIRALAAKGGVVQVNFFAGFLDQAFHEETRRIQERIQPEVTALKERYKTDPAALAQAVDELWGKSFPCPADRSPDRSHRPHRPIGWSGSRRASALIMTAPARSHRAWTT